MSGDQDREPASRPDPGPGGHGPVRRPAVLTAEDLAAILRGRGRLTEAELDALERLDRACLDPDDDPGDDPDCAPPPEWLTVTAEEQRGLLGTDEDLAGLAEDDPEEDPEVLDAGFTHSCPTPGATGFAAGGLLDQMLPGADLAWHTGMARQRGLGTLDDDQLVGFLGAARRLGSWAAALEHDATAELDARRAGPDGREGEHVAAELAAALTLTGRAAQAQLDLSRQLERLPQTRALLAAGIIDRPRVLVITGELALLDDAMAAAVENLIAPRAGGMTTGRLRAACQRAVLACDPQAAIRRREQAEKDARVECWTEAAGTAALAGRDLDRARAITADKTLDADARWLHDHGVPGTLEQLRVEAFLARLNGQPLESLVPPVPAGASAGPARPTAPGPGGPGAAGVWPPAFGAPGSTAAGTAAGTAGPAAPGGTPPGPGSTAAGRVAPGHRRPRPRPGHRRRRPRGQRGQRGQRDRPVAELARAIRFPGRGHRHRRRRARRRPDLPHHRRHPGHQPGHPLVGHHHRPIRAPRRPWPRPGRARTARPRPPRLAHRDQAHPDRRRHLRPPKRVRRVPPLEQAAEPGQNPLPTMRVPRLPPPGLALRRRPYDSPRPGRPDLRVQCVPFVPSTPPNQTSIRVAARPAPARRPGLDRPQRTPLHHHPRALPGLAFLATPATSQVRQREQVSPRGDSLAGCHGRR